MTTEAEINAIRFGYGLGPSLRGLSPDEVLAGLDMGPGAGRRHPMPSADEVRGLVQAFTDARKQGGAGPAYRKARQALQRAYGQAFRAGVARIAEGEAPFFERLTWFWADHFTAAPKSNPMRAGVGPYLDEAIRPHVTGRFADMLKAVVTHPQMLAYLDQVVSVGPNSGPGRRRGRGLNENLAREVLELHTLGVGGAYGQDDVRQLAELMTGLSVERGPAFRFRPAIAEPGAETVLGRSYGGGTARLEDVLAALDDIAAHPDTARHIARKLAVHFVADEPPPGLVADLAADYARTGGDLRSLYAVLVAQGQGPLGGKVKPPFDFLASALVAMGITGNEVAGLRDGVLRRSLGLPLVAMGQPFMLPPGPDGWPETAENWITPQGLATRITWAGAAAERMADRLGEPRAFLETALGGAAGPALRFAVGGAQTRAEGVALVLASAEFNRR